MATCDGILASLATRSLELRVLEQQQGNPMATASAVRTLSLYQQCLRYLCTMPCLILL